MSKFIKKKSGEVPAVSTASLPDIIFMLLFFFMTVTESKDSDLMVQNKLPVADQVQKLDKKDPVVYIYAGKPLPDRWVAMIGARHHVLAREGRARPILLVMVGTAVMVEAIDAEGRFLGGLILPGHGIMLRALESGTAGLHVPTR